MHGDEMLISGTNALGAARVGNNLVYGHTHQASIQYSNAFSRQLWQMNAGCLIDQQAIAFRYAAKNPQRCWLGIGLIELDRNGNSFPILVPANHL
jgi:hypothetical protein